MAAYSTDTRQGAPALSAWGCVMTRATRASRRPCCSSVLWDSRASPAPAWRRWRLRGPAARSSQAAPLTTAPAARTAGLAVSTRSALHLCCVLCARTGQGPARGLGGAVLLLEVPPYWQSRHICLVTLSRSRAGDLCGAPGDPARAAARPPTGRQAQSQPARQCPLTVQARVLRAWRQRVSCRLVRKRMLLGMLWSWSGPCPSMRPKRPRPSHRCVSRQAPLQAGHTKQHGCPGVHCSWAAQTWHIPGAAA